MRTDFRPGYVRLLEGAALAALPLALMGVNACNNDQDQDNDGWTVDAGDCDDQNAETYPGAPELCDNLDNDCNAQVDDGAPQGTFSRDSDADGFGDPSDQVSGCIAPAGYVQDGTDCDDADASIHPGAYDEVGDGTDGNCDGVIDVLDRFAGTGFYGYAGDGGPATSAQLALPRGVAFDLDGNLLIADTNSHAIRRVDGAGIITTLAGTGVKGYTGDGGPATAAQLNFPRAAVVDGAGNVFIADSENNVIRRIDQAGQIQTVVGTGTAGFNGDGHATGVQLNQPKALFLNGDGLYLSDSENHRVRRFDAAGDVTTVAGNGTAGYSGDGGAATEASINDPRGIYLDADGLLYITDVGNDRVRMVDTAGVITTIAGAATNELGDGGPATAAKVADPRGVTGDLAGNLYITDYGSHRIRKIDGDGIITTVAGTGVAGYEGLGGAATAAQLYYPYGLTLDQDSGSIYIADFKNSRVVEIVP